MFRKICFKIKALYGAITYARLFYFNYEAIAHARLSPSNYETIAHAKKVEANHGFTLQNGLDKLFHSTYVFYEKLAESILRTNNLLIIDVGANDGWFAKIIYAFAPDASVLSFEPLPSCHKKLKTLQAVHPTYRFIPKAVGDVVEERDIYELATSGLSSLKENLQESYQLPYETDVIAKYPVDVTTIDNELAQESRKLLLKIDTQGYEMEVLKGAQELFDRNQISCVIVELCTVQKYKEQVLAPEIIKWLAQRGFEIFDLHPFFYETNTGQLTEFDAIFVNKNSCKLKNN